MDGPGRVAIAAVAAATVAGLMSGCTSTRAAPLAAGSATTGAAPRPSSIPPATTPTSTALPVVPTPSTVRRSPAVTPVPATAASRVTAASRHRPPAPSGPGTVTVLKVPTSDTSAPNRDVWVYRPAVPDSASLPVVYFLHGQPGSPEDVFSTGLAAFLDDAFAKGATPFVVAAPDGEGHSHPDSEWADSDDRADLVESFVTSAVVHAVEGGHPRTAATRAIAGFSMGGYGAMNLALRHRDVFGQVVSISGYFHVDDPDGVFDGDAALQAANAPDQHVDAARGLHVLLLDGDDDNEPVVHGEATRFKGLLDGAGIPSTLTIAPGGHSWQYVQTQFPAIVDFVESAFWD